MGGRSRLQAVPFWSVERSETGARRNKREETGRSLQFFRARLFRATSTIQKGTACSLWKKGLCCTPIAHAKVKKLQEAPEVIDSNFCKAGLRRKLNTTATAKYHVAVAIG